MRQPSSLSPWTLEDFADKRPTRCGRAVAANPAQPRCLLCGNLVEYGDLYLAASTRGRTAGRVLHDTCFVAAWANRPPALPEVPTGQGHHETNDSGEGHATDDKESL